MAEILDINNELVEIDEANVDIVRNPKVYLPRHNPLDIYDDDNFRKRYRMRKDTAQYIIGLVQADIANFESRRGMPISAPIQVLLTLRYLAKGAYGLEIADHHGISQPAVSIIVKRVVQAIARLRERFIKFPTNEEQPAVMQQFHGIAGCPRIIGSIDCTHVKIKNPGGENPLLYINRKGYYSLNVQVVSDANCKIRDIVARWRGSTHDSRIWNESYLKRRFEAGEFQGVLLGDNGYPASRYLLTPVLNPTTPSEHRYNTAHCSTRNVVERLFGIWKNKFRCFFNGLNLRLETTRAAIVALAVVHNIILDARLDNEGPDLNSDDDIENEEYPAPGLHEEALDNGPGKYFEPNILKDILINTSILMYKKQTNDN